MSQRHLLTWTAAAAILVLLAPACAGRSEGNLVLTWRVPEQGEPALLQAFAPLPTIVEVTNLSKRTARNLRLYLAPLDPRHAPAGLSVGTVSRVPSGFDGRSQYWELGHLAPGARLLFDLALWPESPLATRGQVILELRLVEGGSQDREASTTLTLSVDLASRDK